MAALGSQASCYSDPGYFGVERKTLQPLDNPFGTRLSPLPQVRSVTHVSGLDKKQTGGEGGIRTPDRLAPMPHFECGAIDHSATSPRRQFGVIPQAPRSGCVLGEDGGPDKARTARFP